MGHGRVHTITYLSCLVAAFTSSSYICKSISLEEREAIRRSGRPCRPRALSASLSAIGKLRPSYALRTDQAHSPTRRPCPPNKSSPPASPCILQLHRLSPSLPTPSTTFSEVALHPSPVTAVFCQLRGRPTAAASSHTQAAAATGGRSDFVTRLPLLLPLTSCAPHPQIPSSLRRLVRRRQRSNGGRILPLAFHLSTPSKHPRAAVPVEVKPRAITFALLRDCRRCRHEIWFCLTAAVSNAQGEYGQ